MVTPDSRDYVYRISMPTSHLSRSHIAEQKGWGMMTHIQGPLVLPPGFNKSLPLKPFSTNAPLTLGTIQTAPTKASNANPIFACKAGNVGCFGNGTLEMIDLIGDGRAGRISGSRGLKMSRREMGMRVDVSSTGVGWP